MGGGDIDCMSCPKPSSHKEQRDNYIRGMGEEKVETLLLTNLGLLSESQCANSKEAEAWTKDCELFSWHILFIALVIDFWL